MSRPELDSDLRRMKANTAHRLRREADDLASEADAKLAMAEVVESTWQLLPQTGPRPDLDTPDDLP
jgi:hypothetical protein